ncbi:hypothetical protein Tco_0890726 [Tanacetum coccineum]|uniref:Reverse transcriptase domain-containing protein n=1 Tax=Tanacetum coccineum TaxID=301880 RepID=A0ABQ5C6F1_9ASTR
MTQFPITLALVPSVTPPNSGMQRNGNNGVLRQSTTIIDNIVRALPPPVCLPISDVAELKDMVKALLLDKKSQAPTPVKAVEESCVTCGGTHSYRNCPATNGNVYRDNIQEYVSQAAAANYNQGNTGYRAPIAN